MNTKTTYSLEQLQAAGGKLWEKNGMRRVYFNDLAALIGLEITLYGTGNIQSARHNGEKISNSEAARMLAGLGKVWYDLNTNTFCGRPGEFCKPDYVIYNKRAQQALIEKLNAA